MNSEGWVIYINFAVVRIEDIDVVWPCVCLRNVLSVGLCSQYSHKVSFFFIDSISRESFSLVDRTQKW